MYRSPLDKLADKVQQAKFGVSAVLHDLRELPYAKTREGKGFLIQMETYLEQLDERAESLKKLAEKTRGDEAIDRAWQLVRIFESGAMTTMHAYELVDHTYPAHQEQYQYPEDLKAKLRDTALTSAVFMKTGY